MSELVRISMSIEKPLYEKMQSMISESGYENRSEFIRDLLRKNIVEQSWEKDKESIGTITLIYDHHTSGLGTRLTHMQHHFQGTIMATTHLHLEEHLCAEMIMAKGKASDIHDLANTMQREKGVMHAALSMTALGAAV